jgi:hypothetical protein
MDYTEGHRAAQMMEKEGGHFASALAKAYYHADSANAQRLRNAFPDLFEPYYVRWEKQTKQDAERNPIPCY